MVEKRHEIWAVVLISVILNVLICSTVWSRPLVIREVQTINRDWKFKLGDPENASSNSLNDSGWEHINLPHSFSMPYFAATDRFYVGYGWYRKVLNCPTEWSGRHVTLDFEGSFQETEVFLNGKAVGSHRGGYTGFEIDLTGTLKPGPNILAIRVNNRWSAQLAPRAGEHQFSGGIYRNVHLVVTDLLHVAWFGTCITTPSISEDAATVNIKTEVVNSHGQAKRVTVRSSVLDADGTIVTAIESSQQIEAGQQVVFDQTSKSIKKPRLWSPDHPNLYSVKTEVLDEARVADDYVSTFGCRWFEFTPDRGFYLNGRHYYFRGANAHQDQAGWGDAVTNAAMERDVRQMKEAGFDFIRGSHYPHAPGFTEACDRVGMLFWSENPFWGTGGFKGDGFWDCSAYPVKAEDRVGFEESVKQSMREMIRVHRNHPSIVVWSLSNEPFFSDPSVMPEVRRFLKELASMTRELDPTRPVAVGGAQRGGIDKLADIAGYNGDGARLAEYQNPGIANVVSEYGSTIADRPGKYEAGWAELEKVPDADKTKSYPWRYPWRSGEVIWCGFDHGSIAGRRFGGMGIVDYFRLPKRSWYWYRNEYLGIAPPEWPKPGTPAGLLLQTDKTILSHADGTDDCQLIVTVVDEKGTPLNNDVPITLTIESGPGEFPTGQSITFEPKSDIAIRDGQAAISFRSYYAGETVIRATSPRLRDASVTIVSLNGPAFVAGKTPLVTARPYVRFEGPRDGASSNPLVSYGRQNPTRASSEAAGQPAHFANDGDPQTYWSAAKPGPGEWVEIDLERFINIHQVRVIFPNKAIHRFVVETSKDGATWETVVDRRNSKQEAAEFVDWIKPSHVGIRVRVTINSTATNAYAQVQEISVLGELAGE